MSLCFDNIYFFNKCLKNNQGSQQRMCIVYDASLIHIRHVKPDAHSIYICNFSKMQIVQPQMFFLGLSEVFSRLLMLFHLRSETLLCDLGMS